MMMRLLSFSCLFLLTLIAPPAPAQSIAPHDPLCFYRSAPVESTDWTINIHDCGIRHVMPIETGEYKTTKNFTGTAYGHLDEPYHGAFIEYNYIGARKDLHYFIIIENNGSDKTSSALYSFRKQGDTLTYHETIAQGGAQCNRAITAADILIDHIEYRKNITALDILDLSTYNPYGLAEESLDDCPDCCYGTAHYKEDGDFTGISLNTDLMPRMESNRADSYEEQTLQQCFEGVMIFWIKQEKIKITPAQLKEMMIEFHEMCTVS